jgi:hypothetical protein
MESDGVPETVTRDNTVVPSHNEGAVVNIVQDDMPQTAATVNTVGPKQKPLRGRRTTRGAKSFYGGQYSVGTGQTKSKD